ncbi:HAD hydrolase-like protein [Candidatus Woesearchaeota archaeon]|nr:HAD hydrolase-like protein [Candidatus Woesearchaeota archaeon]
MDDKNQGPLLAFKRTFKEKGIKVTPDQINRYMGRPKLEHIYLILGTEGVCGQVQRYTQGDKGKFLNLGLELYGEFSRQLPDAIKDTVPIPGVREVAERLKGRGDKLWLNTGYSQEIVKFILSLPQFKWVKPVISGYVCSDDVTSGGVTKGRPHPDMIQHAMVVEKVEDPRKVLVIDDTLDGMCAADNNQSPSILVASGIYQHNLNEAIHQARTLGRARCIMETFASAGRLALDDMLMEMVNKW